MWKGIELQLLLKMSNQSVTDLRTKIKKLKYKLEKEEKQYNQLKQQSQQLKQHLQSNPSLESVLKKISFLLSLKGLTMGDWLNAVEYQPRGNEVRMSELVHVLEEMRIKLTADEKFFLLNFVSQGMGELVTREQVIKCGMKAGVRMTA